jgi:RNA polymerase subunit RPABC4/transcription elongation factor Spt4
MTLEGVIRGWFRHGVSGVDRSRKTLGIDKPSITPLLDCKELNINMACPVCGTTIIHNKFHSCVIRINVGRTFARISEISEKRSKVQCNFSSFHKGIEFALRRTYSNNHSKRGLVYNHCTVDKTKEA